MFCMLPVCRSEGLPRRRSVRDVASDIEEERSETTIKVPRWCCPDSVCPVWQISANECEAKKGGPGTSMTRSLQVVTPSNLPILAGRAAKCKYCEQGELIRIGEVFIVLRFSQYICISQTNFSFQEDHSSYWWSQRRIPWCLGLESLSGSPRRRIIRQNAESVKLILESFNDQLKNQTGYSVIDYISFLTNGKPEQLFVAKSEREAKRARTCIIDALERIREVWCE